MVMLRACICINGAEPASPAQTINKLHPRLDSPRRRLRGDVARNLSATRFLLTSPLPPSLVPPLRQLHKRYGLKGL